MQMGQCQWSRTAHLAAGVYCCVAACCTAHLLCRVAAEVEDSVQFADESPKPEKGQLLENVFADPRGFGIAPDGRYR
jgi:hypothetical protein